MKPPATNQTPTVSILRSSRFSGRVLEEQAPLPLVATVFDADTEDLSSLEIRWMLNEPSKPICRQAVVDSGGESSCEIILFPEMTTVMVEVIDTEGATGTAQYPLRVLPNSAPQIEIINLSTTEIYPGEIPLQLEARISDANDPIGELDLVWRSDIVGELAVSSEFDSQGLFSATTILSEGVHRLSATVTDHLGAQGMDSIQIMVGPSGVPVVDSIGFEDDAGQSIEEAYDGQRIACIVGATNLYSLPLSYSTRWFNEQEEELTVDPSSTSLSLDFEAQHLTDGQSLTCLVTIETENIQVEASATIDLTACNPFATEIPYDGLDSNCDGLESLNDQDGDGQPDQATQDFHDRDQNSARLGVECYGALHTSSESSVYYLICDDARYWKNAQDFCTENGYDSLATLHRSSEFQALTDVLNTSIGYVPPDGSTRSSEIWLGFTRGPDCLPTNNQHAMGFPSICSADPYDYYWLDGGSTGYINATHWWAGEGTPAGEHCATLKLDGGQIGFWDLYCDNTDMYPHRLWAADHVRPSACMRRGAM